MRTLGILESSTISTGRASWCRRARAARSSASTVSSPSSWNRSRAAGPIGANLEQYKGLTLHGAPVTAILEAYNMCQLQPDPGFSDDNNYLKNTIAEEAHLDCFSQLPEEKVILADGTDVTEDVLKAEVCVKRTLARIPFV